MELFARIESRHQALATIDNMSLWLKGVGFTAGAISAAFLLLVPRDGNSGRFVDILVSSVLIVLLAIMMQRLRSRAIAVALFLLSLLASFGAIAAKGLPIGSIISALCSIRAIQATFKLHEMLSADKERSEREGQQDGVKDFDRAFEEFLETQQRPQREP